MKKAILLFGLLCLSGVGTVSCSRDNDEAVVTEKEDFTNANYIKKLMVGKWDGAASSFDGESWYNFESVTNSGYITYYKINTDGTYLYKPFTKTDDNSYNENGTYTIIPASSTNNAILRLSHKYSGGEQTFTTDLVLLSYKDKEVVFRQVSILSPTGLYYYKFKKVEG